YDAANSSINFNLAPIAPGTSSSPQVCNVEFTATVKLPSSSTGASVYRFQNIGDIHTDQLPVYRVSTPPYLFNANGIPNRNETAPQ
ncbi:MAG TPA: hypothetical protein VHQ20_00470, partial [Patescibacteria group bacterium]|nr:hypothetical protein [Patescibacteria group bacterium]